MYTLAFLTSLAALAAAQSSPGPNGEDLNPNTNSSITFHVQVLVQPMSQVGDYEHLDRGYLQPYHTGAGLNDAVFVPKWEDGVTGRFNQTHLQIDVSGSGVFGHELVIDETHTPYAAWNPVRLNAGCGGSSPDASGFFVNFTGLQWTSTYDAPGSDADIFGGWLVCDWWHGLPQLFFRTRSADPNTTTPSSCRDVWLSIPYALYGNETPAPDKTSGDTPESSA